VEDDLEVLGAAAGQILPLAHQPWPLLDCRPLGQERAAAPDCLPIVQPGTWDHAPPDHRVPVCRQVWHEIIAWMCLPCPAPSHDTTSLLDWWHDARQHMVWKQRNDCVFEGAQPSGGARVSLIKEEARMSLRAGTLGHPLSTPLVICLLGGLWNFLSFQWNET
jgi:hypothetical protein